jgi:hypothetical protein
MSNRSKEQGGRAGVGCILLVGLVLLGAGCFTASVVVGGQAGLLRDDPQGMLLLAGLAILGGVALVAVAIRGRR